jgi:hypothetical protein
MPATNANAHSKVQPLQPIRAKTGIVLDELFACQKAGHPHGTSRPLKEQVPKRHKA